MALDIHQALSKLIQNYGPQVYSDRRRLIALLKDVLARDSRAWQVKLLILSIDDGVLDRLLRQLGTMPQALLLENHARNFGESFQIVPEAARWVIETWLYCFGPYEKELAALRPRRSFRPAPPQAIANPPPQPTSLPPSAPLLPPISQPTALPDPDASEFTNPLGMTFVRIPAGSFEMGSPPLEAERDSTEVRHWVQLSQSFYLQTTPVTQSQWQHVMGHNPSAFRGDEHPVEKISWTDCESFITRLNTGGTFQYRLPTEAEWEYAARAGHSSAYFFGERPQDLEDYAWIQSNAGQSTQPVRQKPANPWGLYDIYGNVREYCQDWFGPYPDSPQQDPKGPLKGTYKICRGGSWKFAPAHCRSASRHLTRPGFSSHDIGLRLVLVL